MNLASGLHTNDAAATPATARSLCPCGSQAFLLHTLLHTLHTG
jgi:hypothetical protein